MSVECMDCTSCGRRHSGWGWGKVDDVGEEGTCV
jgi:hypothetical protein